ncbi:MAG: nucleoside hydrolase [Lachnospiraceae bacterium]|nr:nucleoside hydrolase [Lachnospiraceae bacterium]
MVNYHIPNAKKQRVILNTDAKNEVDDQFAIVQAVLTEAFDLRGIIAAHFGTGKSRQSEKDSYEEIQKILKLMNREGTVRVFHGAENALENESTPQDSEGARFIIEEAMKEDSPLYIAFLGPLTDMTSAILIDPEILKKDITVIWIGGGNWPVGGNEYNLKNDIASANVIFKSNIKVWQIPRNVYRMMPVTFSELYTRVRPYGEIGRYLCDNVIEFNNEGEKRPTEYRVLGDSPAIGVMLYEDCGEWEWKSAPEFDMDMKYIHTGTNRDIKVYKNIDARFILEDLYAKLELLSEENEYSI